jgi:hypothetical protein
MKPEHGGSALCGDVICCWKCEIRRGGKKRLFIIGSEVTKEVE